MLDRLVILKASSPASGRCRAAEVLHAVVDSMIESIDYFEASACCAAASLATGTRRGEQLT